MIPGVKSQQTFQEELQQTKKKAEEEQSQIIQKKKEAMFLAACNLSKQNHEEREGLSRLKGD